MKRNKNLGWKELRIYAQTLGYGKDYSVKVYVSPVNHSDLGFNLKANTNLGTDSQKWLLK